MSVLSKAIYPPFRGITKPQMQALLTKMVMCQLWHGPTILLMSRGIGSQRGGMEEVVSAHPDVAECAVLGIADKLKGQIPIGFIILKDGTGRKPSDVESECIQLVRSKIGAVAALKVIIAVERLPKTRSGKILRGTIRKIADGQGWSMPATIDDPVILDEISQALKVRNII